MALYHAAVKKLIPPGANDPRITPRLAILHVDAGNAESLHDFFKNRSGGIESHFHVTRAGVVEQYRDTNFEADANFHANPFAVSIETQGFGDGLWTGPQIAAIKKLLLWLHETHTIPLVKANAWNGSGVGYHILFDEWHPVAKSCPGPRRILQFEKSLVPWMKKVTNPKPAGPVERIATANVLDTLSLADAEKALKAALSRADVLFLQEWTADRNVALKRAGFFTRFPQAARASGRLPVAGWVFTRPATGGAPIGLRAEKYDLLSVKKRRLAKGRRVEVLKGQRTIQPDNHCTVVVARNRATGKAETFINIHLSRMTSPKRTVMHREEQRAIERLVARHKAKGRKVTVAGDTNEHLMSVKGLESCWEGQPIRGTRHEHGTTIDNIYRSERSQFVTLFKNASDHDLVVATYPVDTNTQKN